MIKIKFFDVGCDKKSWTASCVEITFDWLCRQAMTLGGLASSDISFKNVHGKGEIYTREGVVGRFEVVTETVTNKGGSENE